MGIYISIFKEIWLKFSKVCVTKIKRHFTLTDTVNPMIFVIINWRCLCHRLTGGYECSMSETDSGGTNALCQKLTAEVQMLYVRNWQRSYECSMSETDSGATNALCQKLTAEVQMLYVRNWLRRYKCSMS